MTDLLQALPRLYIAPTFDFDGLSVPVGQHLSHTWHSWAEFSARVAVPRLLDMLSRGGWATTWFLPGMTIDTHRPLCERVAAAGNEIAHHGYCHENPEVLSEADERWMLEAGMRSIESLTGSRPAGYRAPFWRSSFRTQDLLAEYGFEYDSSLMATDFEPYLLRRGDDLAAANPREAYKFGVEGPVVEVPVSFHLEDSDHYENPMIDGGPLKAPSTVMEIWHEDIQFAYDNCPQGIVTLTMHPEVTGRGARLAYVEKLLTHWASQPGVQIGTVASYVSAWKTLHGRVAPA